jgi:predicted metal-dependent HD superfamily phosphohydrolase
MLGAVDATEGLLAAWDRLLPGARADGEALLARWAEPHRHYHTPAHLAAVLAVVAGHPARDAAVELAAWFHDAVYDPTRGDNEEASALLAEEVLGRHGHPDRAEAARLVRLTATHDPAPHDLRGALLIDADLAVLAADPPDYDVYAAAVRREYAHVPDDAFRAGRAAVLRHLRALPALYRVLPGRADLERRARANLSRELDRLSPPAGAP